MKSVALVLALAACGSSPKPAPTTVVTQPPPSPPPSDAAPVPTEPAPSSDGATVLAATEMFRVELAALRACTVGAACEAKLVLRTLGTYHVNAEYPTKFVIAPGSAAVTTAFAVSDETTGVMTLTLRPAAAGVAKVTGTLRLAVCTAEVCEIKAPAIAFEIPVAADAAAPPS